MTCPQVNRQIKLWTLTLVMVPFLGACAHTEVNRKLDEKLQAETTPPSTTAIAKESSDLIQKIPDLTAEQRQRLSDLKSATRQKLGEYRTQSLKLRSILIQDILAKDYNEDEVRVIKDRMAKLEKDRLETIFSATEKANGILGRPTPHHSQVMEEFFNMNYRGWE